MTAPAGSEPPDAERETTAALLASVIDDHYWVDADDWCDCGHYVGSRMNAVHKWHLADMQAVRVLNVASNRDETHATNTSNPAGSEPPDELTETVATALREQGLTDLPGEFDSDIHSWRCSYPEIYGPCNCFEEVAAHVAAVVRAHYAEKERAKRKKYTWRNRPPEISALARFLDKVTFDPTGTGCWLWQGAINDTGYGTLYMGEEAHSYRAHRFAYETWVGDIPEGLLLDHLCRVRHCVNPEHLEPVTSRENTLRSPHYTTEAAVCPEGHELTPDNTKQPKGRHFVRCRTCVNERSRKKYWAKKGMEPPPLPGDQA